MSITLYQLGARETAIAALLTESEGELPEGEAGAAIEAYMAELAADLKTKLGSMCRLIQNCSVGSKALIAQARAIEEEGKALRAQARVLENAEKRVKAALLAYFQNHGHTSIEVGDGFKPHVRDNQKAPVIFPLRWLHNPGEAPEVFHQLALNQDAIEAAATTAAIEGYAGLCPNCAAPIERTDDAVIRCEGCEWIGVEAELVRLGAKQQHFRVR